MSSPLLPLSPHLPDVLAALEAHGQVVLEAPAGAGKTTLVPPAVLDAGLARGKEVLVLEPRRLATRMAARRVAADRGETLGDVVGYQVRFESRAGERTRLRYLTEGLFARRLLARPDLAGVGCVVLDEFHERHLQTDVALAAVRRLRDTTRPDLLLVVMSATLDAAPLAIWLGDAPRIRTEGRAWPVEIRHLPRPDSRPLERQVEGALRQVLGEGLDGHVLVFLPGMAEIRRAAEALSPVAKRHDLRIVRLHGDLSSEEQDEATAPAGRPKVILSTNVAETSVTIEGVVAVIDGGLARVASHNPWSGLPLLVLSKISRASAAQRAGRAGRTGPGRCLRLYTAVDHDTRPPFETPEIRRADLARPVLEIRGLGHDPPHFPFFEPPDPASLAAAERLLRLLGAVDGTGRPTAVGRRMLDLPLHPRLGRLVVETERRGAPSIGIEAAALLAGRDLRARAPGGGPAGSSDVLALLDLYREARRRRGPRGACGLARGSLGFADRVVRQLESRVRRPRDARPRAKDEEAALAEALLVAFPDRVARRRVRGRPEVLLSGGGAATLGEESVVRDAPFLVAVDAEARGRKTPLVRLASAIDVEAILETFPDRVGEETVATWNEDAERVEVARRLVYDRLVLEERRGPAAGEPEAAALLLERALARGPQAFADPAGLSRLRVRVAVLSRAFPERGVLPLGDGVVSAVLADLARGCSSFREIRERDLLGRLRAHVETSSPDLLDRLVPERVALDPSWSPRVHYAAGRAPWIEAFVQDFFGLVRGPSICEGRVQVVLHLLAPNRRPVQVTTDLAGFWERHYPGIRRELSRRYPRHAWPEDPRAARPPPRGRRR